MKLLFENWRKYLTEAIGAEENPELSEDPEAFQTAKKPIPLGFRFAETDETIETKEGPVTATAGDAIMTGTEGEQWPIPREKFEQTYDVLDDSTASKKNIPVYAKEMAEPFQVKVSWSSDLLQGESGDFLVQYGPGDYGVVGREIFRKTYEASQLASDPDQPRPDEERYLRNAPRGGELGAYLSELGRDYEQEKTEIASDPLKGPVLDAILRILGPAPDEKMILYASTTLSLLLGDSQLPLHGPGAFFARPLNPADKAAVEAYNDALGQAAAPRHRAATSRRRGPPRGEFV